MNSERREAWLLILGLGALVTAFVFTVVLPGRRSGTELDRRTALAEQRLEAIPTRLRRVAALKATVDEMEAARTAAARAAPSDADVHGVLKRVARLADDAGLNVARLQPLAVETRQVHVRHPFRLECAGDWTAIVRFQLALEAGDRVFTIESLQLDAIPDDASDEEIRMTLEFSTYSGRRDRGDFDDSAESLGARTTDIGTRA